MDGSGMRRMLPGEVRWKNQRAMLPPALLVPRKRSAAPAAELPLSLDERLARAARASIRPERSVRWQRAGSVQAAEQSSVIVSPAATRRASSSMAEVRSRISARYRSRYSGHESGGAPPLPWNAAKSSGLGPSSLTHSSHV